MTEHNTLRSGRMAEALLRLFSKSWPRRVRLREIVRMLGPMAGQTFLDLTNDPAMSYCLRQADALSGGRWQTACLTERDVALTRELVGEGVSLLEGDRLPYDDGSFDAVIVCDLFETVADDERLVAECHRILKPSGRMIVNVSLFRRWSLMRALWSLFCRTDPERPFVRRGYSESELFAVLKNGFDMQERRAYAKFFTELLRLFCNVMTGPRADRPDPRDEQSLRRLSRVIAFYSAVYPFFLLGVGLDALLIFSRGYFLVARAKRRMWVPRRTPFLRDGRSIAEAALGSKIGTAAEF